MHILTWYLLSVVFSKKKNPDTWPGIDGEKELTAVAEDPQQHQEQLMKSRYKVNAPRMEYLRRFTCRGYQSAHPYFSVSGCHMLQSDKDNHADVGDCPHQCFAFSQKLTSDASTMPINAINSICQSRLDRASWCNRTGSLRRTPGSNDESTGDRSSGIDNENMESVRPVSAE